MRHLQNVHLVGAVGFGMVVTGLAGVLAFFENTGRYRATSVVVVGSRLLGLLS